MRTERRMQVMKGQNITKKEHKINCQFSIDGLSRDLRLFSYRYLTYSSWKTERKSIKTAKRQHSKQDSFKGIHKNEL